ncbi:anti-sigma factor [Azorhizobium sp. AG788]|uniref:anti-sigma factor n=1 Tax=Azorhizobium sp. AG788 TaxID=2183897 RepID=UPI00313A2624
MTVNEDDRQFVAEYVLGTLPAALRMMVRARFDDEPEIAKLAQMWQQRLAPLHELAVPIAPPRDLWPDIAAIVAPPDYTPAELASGKAAASAALPEFAIPASEPEDGDADGPSFSKPGAAASSVLSAGPSGSVGRGWKRGAILLGGALVAVGGTFGYREFDRAQEQHYLASLQDSRAAAVLVRLDPRTGDVIVRPLLDPAPDDKTYQLWLVPDGQPARSLGTFKGAFGAKSDAIRKLGVKGAAKAMLQVTLEPEGGSPFAPTGDVLYSGRLLPE